MATAEQQIEESRREIRGDIDTQIQEQRELNKRMGQAWKTEAEARKPFYEEQRKAGEELTKAGKARPELLPLPKPPNVQEITAPSSLQKTFGMAAIFALLAAGITKDRSMAGIAGLGGFLKGAREGNQERAEAAIKDFNNNMTYTLKTNEQSLEQYNAILSNAKLTLEQKERMLKLKMLEFQDQLFGMELEQKGMKGVHDLINQRATLDHQMQMELLRTKQIEAQITHQRAMEKNAEARLRRQEGREAAGLKQADIARIETEARQQISAALPRDQLGQIVLGPEWGKTIEERTRKFEDLVDRRKREIAQQRGLDVFKPMEPAGENPEMALRAGIASGAVKKDTRDAMNFLTKRGVGAAEAAAIIQRVANEPAQY